ncbi:MAG: hypothetical protein M3Q65_17945 [Chloroflexota bacterium]|nr:hypothetical protein [Chloroflexota bacterium]
MGADSRTPIRVLFLSAGNTAGTLIAAGLLRDLGGDRFAAFAAGPEAPTVPPSMLRAIGELGLDAREDALQPPEHYRSEPLDYVVTVCITTCET